MKVIYLRLPDEIANSLKEEAEKKHMTVNLYCRLALGAHKKLMQNIERVIGGENE